MKGSGKGPCKFGFACTRPGCWYEHPVGHTVKNSEPVPCRYGAACTRLDCCFSHPPGRIDPSMRICAGKENQEIGSSNSNDRVCVWFQKGKCKNGSSCQFKHVQQERDGNVIVVRNLPKDVEPSAIELQIMNHFSPFGYISRIQVKTDLDNRSRGFAFVVFDDTECVSKALQCEHPVWDIKCKVALPIYIEGDTRPSRKTTAAARVDAPLRLPFGLSDRVLLVGEGDFSFTAASIACGYLDASIAVATSYEPPHSASHIERLKEQGVQCITNVDAKRLAFSKAFDVIVFNFPHTGEPSIERNRDLLRGFLQSAKDVLRKDGRVAVALKQTWPYSEWQLEESAVAEGFRLAHAYGFPASALRTYGYTHSTTDRIPHQVDFLESAKIHEFVMESC